jgi:hypothetical protein
VDDLDPMDRARRRSINAVVVAVGLAMLAEPALAQCRFGFERNAIIAPSSPYGVPVRYPPYVAPYGPGAYPWPAPVAYGFSPEYLLGANWRDNWYDATHTKVHGYTLR